MLYNRKFSAVITSLFQVIYLTHSAPLPGLFEFTSDGESPVLNIGPNQKASLFDYAKAVLGDPVTAFEDARKAFTDRALAGVGIFASVTDDFRRREDEKKKLLSQENFQNLSVVQFFLYANKLNASDPEEITKDNIASSSYNGSLPLLLITHGFQGNTIRENGSVNTIKLGYFKAQYFATLANVVVMDWSRVNPPPNDAQGIDLWNYYVDVASSVRAVADKVTEFLVAIDAQSLLITSDQNVTDAHFVGNSLGAHLLGLAAQNYTLATGKKIRRLTGTDPAGPLYSNKLPTERFSAGQAVFVDAVHSNPGQLGILGNVATVDFYLNGGVMYQPDCIDPDSYFEVDKYPGCSHRLAFIYFANSIVNQTIEATCDETCNNQTVIFGEGVPTSAHGQFNVVI